MKPNRDYLQDMLDYIQHLESFQVSDESALDDMKTQLAVSKAYEVLGEIAKRLPDPLLQQEPQIAWKQLKGMRDILIHRYDDIDLHLLWEALEQLPALHAAVEALLASLPDDEGDARRRGGQ